MSDNEKNVNLNSFYVGNGQTKLKPKKKKRNKFTKWWAGLSKKKRIVFCTVSSVLATLIVLGSFMGIYVSVILNKLGSDNDFSKLNNEDLGIENVINKDITNIALFGVDTRTKGDFTGLSDTIIILSINKKENTIKLVSIMRDSLVPIEDNGKVSYAKINTAYSRGGPALAVKNLNKLFNLDISSYATVNFYGMADIIDAVGGIEIDVTQAEIDEPDYGINAVIEEHYVNVGKDPTPYFIYKTGKQKVNGMQAVAYARIRKAVNVFGTNNDFGRIDRQRYVLNKIMEKVMAMDVTTYPSLVSKLTPYVKTSLTNAQMLSLASLLAQKPTLIQTRVPHNEYIINADYRGTGASSVYYNYKYAAKVIHAFFYENTSPEDYMAAFGVDLTGWYKASSSQGSSYGGSTGSSSQSPSSSTDSSSSEESTVTPDETPEEPVESSTPETPETSETPETPEESAPSVDNNTSDTGEEDTPNDDAGSTTTE